MITKEVKVWIGSPQGIAPVVRLSQYDTAWKFIFTVYNGVEPWIIPEGTTVVLNGRKPDGTVFSFPGVIEGNNAVVGCRTQMTSAVGKVECELRFGVREGNDDYIVATANFTIKVERAPLAGYIASRTDFTEMSQLIDELLASVRSHYTVDITIPSTGWKTSEDQDEGKLSIDVACEKSVADSIPFVFLDRASKEIAASAEMNDSPDTLDGAIRFWANEVPTEDMTGTVVLLGANTSGGVGHASTLHVATKDILGGIKASDTVIVDDGGTAHVHLTDEFFATDEEVKAALDDVYGPSAD